MKKNFFLLFFLTAFISNAQFSPHAIGVRLGGSHYGDYGGEISYQHALGSNNRLEFDLGWRNHNNWSHMGLSVIYHWGWNITDGLNWYVGPAARVGFWQDKGPDDDYIGIAVGGQLGIEYDFNEHSVPLQVSLDVRPLWNFIGTYGGFGYGTALGIRYTF